MKHTLNRYQFISGWLLIAGIVFGPSSLLSDETNNSDDETSSSAAPSDTPSAPPAEEAGGSNDAAPPPPEPPSDTGPPNQTASTAPSSAKEILTLDQCLKRALTNSKKIEAERHRVKMLEEKQDQLWWLPFSDINLSGAFAMVPDKCADISGGELNNCPGDKSIPTDDDYFKKEWGPSCHIKLRATLPIPTSNQYSKAKEALREAKAAKETMLPTIAHQIAYDVHRAFHSVVGAREMRYTLSQGRKHLVKARRKVEENLEKQTGGDTAIDLLKLKVFESRLDAMEQQVIQLEKSALAAMNFLVGAEEGRAIDLPEDPQEIIHRELKSLDEYKTAALKQRPEFEALRHGIKALEAKIKATRGIFAPKLGITFGIRAGYTQGVRVLGDEGGERPNFLYRNSYNYGNIIPGVALVMSMPLDFGVTYHKVQEAKADLAAALADKSLAMEGILLEVETTFIEVTTLVDTIDALNKTKKIAKGWMNAAVQNHAIGLGSSKELKDALKEYFAIMGELHQKIGEYNIALAKLDKVTGVLPTPANSESKKVAAR